MITEVKTLKLTENKRNTLITQHRAKVEKVGDCVRIIYNEQVLDVKIDDIRKVVR